jgi:hypothetical protein
MSCQIAGDFCKHYSKLLIVLKDLFPRKKVTLESIYVDGESYETFLTFVGLTRMVGNAHPTTHRFSYEQQDEYEIP